MEEKWIIKQAEFLTSAGTEGAYPAQLPCEIAIVGKSNVGKSSLINALTNNHKLAKTSSQPGKTRLINFFLLNRSLYLVDLPGYGFARTNRKNKEQWSGFIRKYLEEAPNLALVCQLIDIRHKLMESDIEAYNWLTAGGLTVHVVLTKADKIGKNVAVSQRAAFKKALGLADEQITAYSVLQPAMRLDFINRIMASLEAGSEVTVEI